MSRRHSRTSPSVSRRTSAGLCSTQARAVRRHQSVSGIPVRRSAGHVSGAAIANSRNAGPNQPTESRVGSASKRRIVSSSTAAKGRPARAQAPRCSVVQSGAGCVRAMASRSGAGATIQVARPPATECGDRPAAAGLAPGPSSSRCCEAAATTRAAFHAGSAATAASGLGKPGGGRSASSVTPNASCSSCRAAAARAVSATEPVAPWPPRPDSEPGIRTNPSNDAASNAPHAPNSSSGFSRTPHTTLAAVAAAPSAATTGAAVSRASSAPPARSPCSPATDWAGSSTAPQVSVRASRASSRPRWARACAFADGSQRRNRSDPIPAYRSPTTRVAELTAARASARNCSLHGSVPR